MSATRRSVIGGAAAGVGLAVAGTMPALAETTPGQRSGQGRTGPAPVGHTPFPPLRDDPDGILALAEGFSYAIVTRAGVTKLDSGETTPSNHDGTAVVGAQGGTYTLIQNHELPAGSAQGVPHRAGTVYDPGALAGGGCTVIRTNAKGDNLGEFVGISGTATNCAGGPTPWGTWLTCEETETKKGTAWSGNGRSGTYQKDHGYVFEVHADGKADPKPLRFLGRYAHEACAVDVDRTHIYLSEDASGPNGLFYRWTAPKGVRVAPGVLPTLADDAGELAAMAIQMPDGSVLPDVAYLTSAQIGRPFPVEWVPVPERDGQTTSVRKQFTDEVTRGKKFEGVYGTSAGVYVVNSFAEANTTDVPEGAVPHDGMVWFYNYEKETIQLVSYFPHNDQTWQTGHSKYDDLVFDGPDNVTVTPWGSLVLAEDGEGASHVLGSFPNGPTYAIARNQLNDSEFTGPTFSPDGKVLFVNIQTPGITLAITGPWEKYLG